MVGCADSIEAGSYSIAVSCQANSCQNSCGSILEIRLGRHLWNRADGRGNKTDYKVVQRVTGSFMNPCPGFRFGASTGGFIGLSVERIIF